MFKKLRRWTSWKWRWLSYLEHSYYNEMKLKYKWFPVLETFFFFVIMLPIVHWYRSITLLVRRSNPRWGEGRWRSAT